MDFSFDTTAEYADQTFKRLHYQQRLVDRRTFDNCTFTHCSFQGTFFQNCRFRDCTFLDSDLRLMRVAGASFRNTVFKKCAVVGVNWVEASWSKTGLLESIGFVECDVSQSIFMGLDLRKLVLTQCVANDADFAETNLSQANFTSTDLAQSRFLHTDLTEADFTNARNYAIDVRLNTVKKAKFSLPDAVNLLRCMDIVLVEGLADA